MSWLIAGHVFGDNDLTFDVLRMTRVGVNGQRCFIKRFFAVACIVTICRRIVSRPTECAKMEASRFG